MIEERAEGNCVLCCGLLDLVKLDGIPRLSRYALHCARAVISHPTSGSEDED